MKLAARVYYNDVFGGNYFLNIYRQTGEDMNTNGDKKLSKESQNGFELPRAKDLKNPKHLTKIQKELVEATREAMKAFKEEEAKYGKKDFSHF